MELPQTLEGIAERGEESDNVLFYDHNDKPLQRGVYVRVKDEVIYYISNVNEESFLASTAKGRIVSPLHGNPAKAYASFARELSRLEDSALGHLNHQVTFSAHKK